MFHIPLLRNGEPYRSLDVARVSHHRTHNLFVEISQANAGLIRRDLRDQELGREKLWKFSTAELVDLRARGWTLRKLFAATRRSPAEVRRLRTASFRHHRPASFVGTTKHAEDTWCNGRD